MSAGGHCATYYHWPFRGLGTEGASEQRSVLAAFRSGLEASDGETYSSAASRGAVRSGGEQSSVELRAPAGRERSAM